MEDKDQRIGQSSEVRVGETFGGSVLDSILRESCKVQSAGATSSKTKHLHSDVPWYEPILKRIVLIMPAVYFSLSGLVAIFTISKTIATVGEGPFTEVGPTRFTIPSEQFAWQANLQSSAKFQIFSNTVILDKLPPQPTYFTCANNEPIRKLSRSCNFTTDVAFISLMLALGGWGVLYTTIFGSYCWFSYSTSDLRFFINAEKFKSSNISLLVVFFGFFITFGGLIVGFYYCNTNFAPGDVYISLVVFALINCLSLLSLRVSSFPDLKHLDITNVFPNPIMVLPYQLHERNWANGWGCWITSAAVVRKLEQAMLLAAIHNDAEYVERYGHREQLVGCIERIHRKHQSDDLGTEYHKSCFGLCCEKKVVAPEHPPNVDWAADREKEVKSSNGGMMLSLKRFLVLIPIATICLNSLGNVASASRYAHTTYFDTYPKSNSLPWLIDTPSSQEFLRDSPARKPGTTWKSIVNNTNSDNGHFKKTYNNKCSDYFPFASSCYYAELKTTERLIEFALMLIDTDPGIEFGAAFQTMWYSLTGNYAYFGNILKPQNTLCNDLDIIDASVVCPHENSLQYLILYYSWLAWGALTALSHLFASMQFRANDARFFIQRERFMGSWWNTVLVFLGFGLTCATAGVALGYTKAAQFLVWIDVLRFSALNIASLMTLCALTSRKILRFNPSNAPQVAMVSGRMDSSNVLYVLEQALLRTYLTKNVMHIERLCSQDQVVKLLEAAYLNDEKEGERETGNANAVKTKAIAPAPSDADTDVRHVMRDQQPIAESTASTNANATQDTAQGLISAPQGNQ